MAGFDTTLAFHGRWYRYGALHLEKRLAWSEAMDRLPEASAFCRSTPPHDGWIEDEKDPFGDLSVWPSMAWIRHQEKKVSHRAVQLAVYARQPAILSLPTWQQREVFEEEKERMLAETAPQLKIVPVLRWDEETLFLSSRSPKIEWVELLNPVFLPHAGGSLTIDPMVFPSQTSSLDKLARAVLVRSLAESDPDVLPLSCRIGTESLTFTLKGSDALLGDVLRQALDKRPSFTQLSLRIRQPGERVDIDLDEQGMHGAKPPSSKGGLPLERLRRRIGSVTRACHFLERWVRQPPKSP